MPASYGAQVSGDEPHYLLTAISLGEDHDLDVSDEVDGGRHAPFHRAALDPQARRLAGGRLVAPHDPLLPLLLAAPMAWGSWVAAKLTLAALSGALAALLLWVCVRRFGVPLPGALAVVLVFSTSAPIAVYGAQVYPEVPAALALTAALAALTGPLRAGGLALLALAVVALPWLSSKYAPVAAVPAALALVLLAKRGARARAVLLALALAAAAAFFALAHQRWYGGWTPYAAGDHFASGELAVVGRDPDWVGRSGRAIGLLVDRTFGLAAWQPAWLLALPALGALARGRPRHWHALVFVLAVGWAVATFVALTMHGWWWPGRQVVVVLPAVVIAVAWWAGRSRARLAAVVSAGALGVLSYGWFIVEGLGGRVTWVVDFFATNNPWYRAWRLLLPDYTTPAPLTWVLHGLWVAAAVALLALGWRAGARARCRATGDPAAP